jgi:hypothetical protein
MKRTFLLLIVSTCFGSAAFAQRINTNEIKVRQRASTPTCSTGSGTIWFDDSTNKFRACQNGGAAFDLVGAGSGDALVANPLSQFAATTSAQLASTISNETGSGLLVFATSPTLTTPVLGVAAATSINKVAFTAPASAATLTIADGKTATFSNTITFAGTDSTVMTFPGTSATIARTDAANTFTGVQTMTSPSVTTSLVTGSTTFALLNTTATTVNAFGATTALNIGAGAATVLNFGGHTSAAEFRFLEPSGSGTNYSAFKAVAQGASITYSLPPTVGAAGTVLTDVAGDGVLTWAAGGGGGLTVGVSTIISGTATRLLYETSGNVLGEISGVTSNGTAITATAGNLIATSPRFVTGINDTNGNELFLLTATASAVNEFTIANAATGGSPTITASGGDTNISIGLIPKGSGAIGIGGVTSSEGGIKLRPGTSQPELVLGDGTGRNHLWLASAYFSSTEASYAPTVYIADMGGSAGKVSFTSNVNGGIGWSSSSSDASQALQTAIMQPSAGVVEINNGTLTILRDLKARDVSLSGGVATGVGGSVAGMLTLTEGSTPTATANAFAIYAPADITGTLAYVLPAAAGSGVLQSTNSSGIMTLSHSALTSGRVTIATTNGLLADDSDLTFSGSTLTATNAAVTTGLTVAGAAITNNVVQNSQSTAYTTVIGDAGKHILHPTADNNARTFTIDSNANVAYPIGTTITFVNQINTVTIAITSDTLVLAGAGTTGSRTLAANGVATAIKISSTVWIISGTGLT